MAKSGNSAQADEHFYDVLASRSQGHAGAEALRDALEAEARTLQEAEEARTEDLSVHERSQMDAIKQQLIDQGVLGSPISPALERYQEQTRRKKSSNYYAQTLPNKLLQWLLGDNWQRPLAIAASLLVATVVVMQTLPQGGNDVESNVIRGEAGVSVAVDDPAMVAKNLKDLLTKMRAEVVLVQINDDEWALQVSVADKANVDAVRQSIRDKGFDVQGEPPFELSLTRRQ